MIPHEACQCSDARGQEHTLSNSGSGGRWAGFRVLAVSLAAVASFAELHCPSKIGDKNACPPAGHLWRLKEAEEPSGAGGGCACTDWYLDGE